MIMLVWLNLVGLNTMRASILMLIVRNECLKMYPIFTQKKILSKPNETPNAVEQISISFSLIWESYTKKVKSFTS